MYKHLGLHAPLLHARTAQCTQTHTSTTHTSHGGVYTRLGVHTCPPWCTHTSVTRTRSSVYTHLGVHTSAPWCAHTSVTHTHTHAPRCTRIAARCTHTSVTHSSQLGVRTPPRHALLSWLYTRPGCTHARLQLAAPPAPRRWKGCCSPRHASYPPAMTAGDLCPPSAFSHTCRVKASRGSSISAFSRSWSPSPVK